ncbi:hypothetical protein LY76DRAFT_628684 [Colletotrichum caudatum]|nr:hypothetical protein LY76DRAFT_628684 [Colletotrichum caudatum]
MESGSACSSAKLLSDDDDTSRLDHGQICYRCEGKIAHDTSRLPFSGLRLVLMFGNFPLERSSATGKAYDIVDAADPSPDADRFWHDLRKSIWARQTNLPSTINVFHSLHCLYRIRNRLVSNITLDRWPRNAIHTVHYLDHIRNDLMCHADISLSGSDEFVSFNRHGQDQKCRDLAAIQRWAREHSWPGYSDYLQSVVGYDANEAERANVAKANKGHWNKANSTLDKHSGKIQLWFKD